VAMRRSDIGAVVALDGSVKYYPEVVKQLLYDEPAAMRAAFMMISQSWQRLELQSRLHKTQLDSATRHRITQPFTFFDAIAVDRYWVRMLKFHHGNFSSMFTMLDAEPMNGEPTRAED